MHHKSLCGERPNGEKRLVLITTLIAFALGISLSACSRKAGSVTGQTGDSLTHIKAKGEIIIATEGNRSPWAYHDDKGKLTGFDVEIAQKVAKKLGVKARFVESEWDGILAGVDSGMFDIAFSGIEVTADRMKDYSFSIPYAYLHTAIITHQSENDITSFKDLNGRITANSKSSNYAKLAESFGAKVRTIDTFEDAILLVIQGKVDATLNAEASFYDYMKSHPDTQIKITALYPESSNVAAVIRKTDNSERLVTEVNQALTLMLSNSEISRISEKYFGSDLSME